MQWLTNQILSMTQFLFFIFSSNSFAYEYIKQLHFSFFFSSIKGIIPGFNQGFTWLSSYSYAEIPPNAVSAGHDADGSPIFVGRAFHEGYQIPAKVIPSKHVAYISYAGQEIPKQQYEACDFICIISANGCAKPHCTFRCYSGRDSLGCHRKMATLILMQLLLDINQMANHCLLAVRISKVVWHLERFIVRTVVCIFLSVASNNVSINMKFLLVCTNVRNVS